MTLPTETRLLLENQLVILATLRTMWTGFADRNMLNDDALRYGRLDSQMAKTMNALNDDLHGADVDAVKLTRGIPCPHQEACMNGTKSPCFCYPNRKART